MSARYAAADEIVAVLSFPVCLSFDGFRTIFASFPDFPDVMAFGDSLEEALADAELHLSTALDCLRLDGLPIPAPSQCSLGSWVTIAMKPLFGIEQAGLQMASR